MKQRKPKLKSRTRPNELKALDRWIKADGALLSRQQAIRRILSTALGSL
jgi:hypothetical protein